MPRLAVQNMNYSYNYTSPTTSYISKTGLSNTAALVSSLACGGWFKLSSAANGGFPLFFYIFGQLQFFYSESGKRLGINGNINGMFYNTNFTGNQFNFHTGGWVHLCITYDGTTIGGYINGGLVNTFTAGGPINISTTTFAAGGTGSNSFTGKMKQIFLSTFMTSAQIAEIYKSGQISSTPYILWNLDEGTGSTATDSSGNGNHGTITDGTWTTDTPSKARTTANARMSVTNTNASLSILSNTNTPCRKVSATGISLASGTISFGLFFKMSNYNSNAYPHLINIGAEDELSVFWDKNVGNLNFKALAAPGGSIAESMGVATAPYNTWNSLVVNYDGANIRGYLNGVLVYTKARTGSFAFTNTTINAGSNTGTSSINGNISNVFVSQNALTIEQINKFAKNMVLPSGSAVTWPLNEGAGTIAYNASGNGNNGTITNGTWSADVPSKKRGVVGGNMIYNGDFSFVPMVNVPQTSGNVWVDGTAAGSATNALFGWSRYFVSNSGSVLFDTAEKLNGNNSIKISTTAIGSQVVASTVLLSGKPNIPLLPNTSYTFTYWMKTSYVSGDSGGGAFARIKETDANNNNAFYRVGTTVKATTGWTKYTVVWTTSSTTRFAEVDLIILGDTGAGTLIMDAWFADIQLRPTTAVSRGVSQ